jgi:UDP-4-amino-4,6-dideoxy-N-acetyl-beta-L-altrosamine N-acetyltransferase
MIKVLLREITKCSDEQKKVVRDVRNQHSVRKSMYTEHEITLDEHLSWVKRLGSDKRQLVFVVFVDNVVSGVVSVNAIDRSHKKSDWAFYLDENVRGGLGAALEYTLINFVFENLNIEKLNCEVISTNEAVVKLHKKFGFVEEGFRRENIEKDGKRIGVYFLGLTKTDWCRYKKEVYEKYRKIISKFGIKVEYNGE